MLQRRTLQVVDNSPTQITVLYWLRLALILGANACTVLAYGWRESIFSETALLRLLSAGLAADLLITLAVVAFAGAREARVRAMRDAGVLATAIEVVSLVVGIFVSWALPLGAAMVIGVRLLRLYLVIVRTKVPPSLILVVSFAMLILAGAAGLMLPASTPVDHPISALDALFTATSSVCVTGLVVRDTGTEFTRLGQVIILIMIQLGGLGIVVFGAIFAVLFGRSIGLRGSQTLAGATGEAASTPDALRRLVLFIAAATVLTELVSAVALFIGWPSADGWATAPPGFEQPDERAFHALFYTVSAFNNAGFATAPDSLHGLRTHWTSHVVIAGLIVLGGIGFPVLDDLRRVAIARIRRKRIENGRLVRLSLHTRMVLTASVALYIAGFLGVFISEIVQTAESVPEAALDAHFNSITARTAGFETVRPSSLGPLARFAITVLMFIGGSPGSAAGGAKTIAFAVLALAVWATINGRASAQAFKRTLPDEMVRKAATFVTLHLVLVATTTGLLSITEPRHNGFALEQLLFEAVSACSTVGLSLDTTMSLSPEGRAVVIAAMFLGRVGLLAALVALVSVARDTKVRYAYPTEGVLIN